MSQTCSLAAINSAAVYRPITYPSICPDIPYNIQQISSHRTICPDIPYNIQKICPDIPYNIQQISSHRTYPTTYKKYPSICPDKPYNIYPTTYTLQHIPYSIQKISFNLSGHTLQHTKNLSGHILQHTKNIQSGRLRGDLHD